MLDIVLEHPLHFWREAAQNIGLTRQRRGADAVRFHAVIGQGLLKTGQQGKNPDRTGNRPGFSENPAGRGGNPVSPAGRDIGHRGDDRPPLGLEPFERQTNLFRGIDRATRRIDAQHQCLGIAGGRLIDQAGDSLSSGSARTVLAIDDVARHGDDRHGIAALLLRMGGQQGLVMIARKGAGRVVQLVLARNRLDPLAEGHLVAQLVHQTSGQRSLCRIALGRSQPAHRIACDQLKIGLGPGLGEIFLPVFKHGPQQGAPRLARGFRSLIVEVRLNKVLVGPDPVHVDVHLEALEQVAEIQAVAARPHDERTAQRVQPNLAGMGGQQHPVIGVGHRIGQHRLLRGADLIHRRADFLQVDEAAAAELRQVHNHGLDSWISCRQFDRADDIARLVFVRLIANREQVLQRIARRRLFDHGSIDAQHQGAIHQRSRTGPGSQHGVKPDEEQQHEQQDQTVLDRNQEMPNLARENHAGTLEITPMHIGSRKRIGESAVDKRQSCIVG